MIFKHFVTILSVTEGTPAITHVGQRTFCGVGSPPTLMWALRIRVTEELSEWP